MLGRSADSGTFEPSSRARALVASAIAALALGGVAAGCGGGERQDEDEPEGTFEVEVVEADFPSDQKLARRSELTIRVKNTGTEPIPNIAVTLDGFDIRERSAENPREDDPRLADPTRPVFVINGEPVEIGGIPDARAAGPEGGETAYVNTWALGELEPGRVATFEWDVTALRAGPYEVTYRVAAGLDGRAKAVLESGLPAEGTFIGTIEGDAPDTRVNFDDGRTVERGDDSDGRVDSDDEDEDESEEAGAQDDRSGGSGPNR